MRASPVDVAGYDEELEDVDATAVDDDLDIDDELEEAAPAPAPKPLRTKQYKPGHRILPAAQKASGELPWWATASRDQFTRIAETQRERMESEKPKVANSVKGTLNEV